MSDKRKDDDTILIAAASIQKLDEQTELEASLGITQEYNAINRRKLWDSPADKTAHKDAVFGQKDTYQDPVTGALLHRHQTAAKRKYHMRSPDGRKISSAWAKHATETDHIIPLQQLHKRFKYNLFLSDKDLKEIANRKRNYREISKQFNTSKGAKSDIQIALDPKSGLPLKGRAILLSEKATAEIDISLAATIKTGENIWKIGLEGAQNALAASAIPLVIRGTQDLMRVANGEMTAKQAAEELGTLGISIAASGGTTRVATFALSSALENSSNDILKRFADVNQIGTVLVIGSIVARATGKYLNGEVDGAGFFREIGQDGLSLASGMIASKVVVGLLPAGGPTAVASVLAAMAASAACSEIYAQAQRLEEEKRSNQAIRDIAAAASASVRDQQMQLRRLLERDHAQWAEEMTDIFQKIASGITDSDVGKTNSALLQLMNSFHREIKLYGEEDSVIQDLLDVRDGKKALHLLRG